MAATTPMAMLNHSSLDVAPSTVSRGSATTKRRPSGPVRAITRQSEVPWPAGTVVGRPSVSVREDAAAGSRGRPSPLPRESRRSRPSAP